MFGTHAVLVTFSVAWLFKSNEGKEHHVHVCGSEGCVEFKNLPADSEASTLSHSKQRIVTVFEVDEVYVGGLAALPAAPLVRTLYLRERT